MLSVGMEFSWRSRAMPIMYSSSSVVIHVAKFFSKALKAIKTENRTPVKNFPYYSYNNYYYLEAN